MSSRTPESFVLVGVNGSGNSLRAVRWAAAEADRRRVPLRIVHATPSALHNPPDEWRAASILALAHAVATHGQPRVPTHTECVHERPARALTAAAETARLLVVGMGSRRGCDGVLIRSLALDVCAAASCPVVVVRGPAGPMSTDGPVVLGLDDVGSDVGAITAAFADADAPARRLVVVHALRGPEAMVDAMAGHPASARVAAKQEITTALAPWRSRHPGVPVEVRVVHGAPADRLLEAAAAARLLVVGTNARGPAARVVLDSTSRAVLRCSPCPVMVVPRDARVLDAEVQVVDTAVTRTGVVGPAAARPRRTVVSEPLWAEMRETHIGVVFLVGERAYKMKKPVTTAFLDFSTPERRLAACRREVELNRRLAPDVYLGVSGVSGAEVPPWTGRGADGAPVEHLVVMRRMPDDRRLSTLVRAGAPVRDHVRDLARSVAAFHAAARRGPDVTAEGSRDALAGRWAANVEQVRAQRSVPAPETVDAVDRLAARFLAGRGPLFADRCADGRIVDGHGDLIADDVFCLDDGPRALDCLEFDDKLRYVDGLDDVAFLAMDLERLGRPDLADDWLDDYVEFSGDPAPVALRHHYVAYRAFVRAKVACLRHQQGDASAATGAAQYADLGLRHLEAGAVRLALVGGLPGTGKTTVGGALADRFGAVLLSSDRLRKELAGLAPTQPAPAAYGEGLYTAERTDTVYAQLLHRAGTLLSRGESVVLDASWTHARHRMAAEELARRTHSDLVRLECRAPADLAAARLAGRGPTASDATAAVGRAMSAAADPWPDAVTVCTSGEVADSLHQAAQAWQA